MKTTTRSIALAAAVATIPACTGGEPCDNVVGSPYPREILDVDMLVGDTVEMPLKGHFYLPPECVANHSHPDYAIFEVTSAEPAAVAVSMADLTTLAIAALEVSDSVRVTVVGVFHAPDGHRFLVRVRAP